ncbi:hypothetical protein I4I84_05750 [Pseudonocardia sp. KRD-182]|uniref:hypothetical protein n=1 Tax=Pseudonocardia oceani TaxID=2792013 RepID=UPI001C4A0777|nr:hypothetical protein [Pseudonocardia oceani]MBW0108240.1 hypothetical protein [Pseudonocardia oceani]
MDDGVGTLKEIKHVLDLQALRKAALRAGTGILDAYITGIDRTLVDLCRLRRSCWPRAALAARRGGHAAVVCQIIENAPEPVRA